MDLCVLSFDVVIEGIRFTTREIDILSGLVNGRSAKSIALLLSISSKTVETHVRNIMIKLDCSSKEQILDFVERSGQRHVFYQHYQNLLENASLEKILKKSAQLCQSSEKHCLVVCLLQHSSSVKCCRLAAHLKLAGLNVTLVREIPQNFENRNIIFLTDNQQSQDFASKLSGAERKSVLIVDVKNSYSQNIIKILEVFYPHRITKEDKKNMQSYFSNAPKQSLPAVPSFFSSKKHLKLFVPLLRRVLLILVSLFLCSGGIFLLFNKPAPTFRQDLKTMSEEHFLKRSQLVKKMDEILKKQSGIQALVLVGPGGSGKTMLARYYARQQKTRVLFEINAETSISRAEGLSNLANFLAYTKKLKERLSFIQAIKNFQEKEKQLLHFIQFNLKSLKSWCLLLDNVEQFQDIRGVFPADAKSWGRGKIIMTTRNENLQNVAQITPSRTLFITELSEEDRFTLFNKVYYNSARPKLVLEEEIKEKEFLRCLPSFPLDVSAAAHYIKNTSISFDNYLKIISQTNLQFDQMQKQILNENLGYSKTRYSIVSTIFQKILKNRPEFEELLLLICLVDSQNIPKEFLYQCQRDKQCVDEFLYHLKRHSFIEDNKNFFSIHRSIPKIGLDYVSTLLNGPKFLHCLEHILSIIAPSVCWFYDKDTSPYLRNPNFLVSHLKTALVKIQEMQALKADNKNKIIAKILLTLGHIYHVWNLHVRVAKSYYQRILDRDDLKNALSPHDQAVLYLNFGYDIILEGDYKKGKSYIKTSIHTIEQCKHSKPLKIMGFALLSSYYAQTRLFFSEKEKHFSSLALNLLKNTEKPWKLHIGSQLFHILAGNYLNRPHSKKNIQVALEYSLKSVHLINQLFIDQNGIFTSLRLSECYYALGKYKQGLEFCKLFEKTQQAKERKKQGTTIVQDLFVLRAESTALLRLGQIQKAEKKLLYVLNAFFQMQEPRRVSDTIPALVETEIRLAKLGHAYEYCLYASNFFKSRRIDFRNVRSQLSILSLSYHAALIKYLQKDYCLSLLHFSNFFRDMDQFCRGFLDKEIYNELAQNRSFDIIQDPQQILQCFNQSLLIFTAIYGPEHPFVKDYIAKKGNLYSWWQRIFYFLRDSYEGLLSWLGFESYRSKRETIVKHFFIASD